MATATRILVIDDEEPTILGFARMLRLEGFDVESAMDGETGLRISSMIGRLPNLNSSVRSCGTNRSGWTI